MKKEKSKVVSMKLEFGSIRQKVAGGAFFYRYQLNGQRKEVPLQTSNKEEALRKAKELIPLTRAQTIELVAAHVNQARGLEKQSMHLALAEAWDIYSTSSERAMPFTVSEQQAYQSTFAEFREMIGIQAKSVDEVTPKVAEFYADKLRKLPLAVDTHNRKIKRIRKVFSVLKEYYAHPNPFLSKALLRSAREEQGKVPRRTAFSREEEQKLLQELDNPKRKLINKIEVRVVYHIGMFTGQRLKDCVLMQWQNIDMERKRIYVKQFKTGKEVSIPIAPELFAVLQEALKWKIDLYVCPKTAARYNQENGEGKNVGNNLVDIDVLRVIRWAGLEPSVKIPGRKKKVTVYGFHSLRHSFASFCATAGVPKAVLLSILGTDSDIADKYYTHVGEEAQLQAISAISNSMSATTPQGRINSVLELLEHTDLQHPLVQQIRTMLAS